MVEGLKIKEESEKLKGPFRASDYCGICEECGDYEVLRIKQMPKQVEVHIVNSEQPPTGVGEPGTPVIAPAVANALFSVTGKRYYELPIKEI